MNASGKSEDEGRKAMYIQRAELPSDRFTQISNQWLRDKRLSWKGRGLLAWLASHSAGFTISEQAIVAAAPDGRDAARGAVRELESYGYLRRIQTRDEGGKLGPVAYVLLDPWAGNPQVSTVDGKPGDGGAGGEPPVEDPQVTTVDGKSVDGETVDGKPVDGPTSNNSDKPQVATVDGLTVDGKSTPIRRLKSKNTKNQKTKRAPRVPAAGGVTRRTARAPVAPPANQSGFAARSLIAGIPRYRAAPGWVRRHLTALAAAALDSGFGRDAILRYADLVIAEQTFKDHQHIPEFRAALARLGRDALLLAACPRCAGDPGEGLCCIDPTTDLPWTEDDQAQLELALERLAPTADELETGSL